ncbi:MAG: magnesium transporter [Acholeplasmatales bacterium]|nr:magnesium transporter [Acholeplasmatales bacterium]
MARDFYKQIRTIIYSKDSDDKKRELFDDYHENDIANVVEKLSKTERKKLYKILGVDKTAEIFTYLDNVDEYIDELNFEEAAAILERMDADDAVDVLDELEDEDKTEILNRMDSESQEDVKLINSYDEEEIGSKMTTNFITVPLDSTVKSAMKEMIHQAAENDNINTIFVLNDDDTLYGLVGLKDLITARTQDNFEDLIMTNYPSVLDKALVSDVINDIRDYDMDSIPVLTEDKKLVGVITYSDVVESVDDELSDDYAKLAGLTEEEEDDESLYGSVKKRIPWLIILMFLGLLVSSVVGGFEHVIKALPVIVFFQSMVLDMAGNVGTQSLAVTIRAISDDNHDTKKTLRLIIREIQIGFVNGLVLGIFTCLFATLYLGVTRKTIELDVAFSWFECFKAGGILGVSLLIAMTLSSLTGSGLPVLLTKMRIDPAVASGPFITTINDLIAVSVYYGLAYLLFMVF